MPNESNAFRHHPRLPGGLQQDSLMYKLKTRFTLIIFVEDEQVIFGQLT